MVSSLDHFPEDDKTLFFVAEKKIPLCIATFPLSNTLLGDSGTLLGWSHYSAVINIATVYKDEQVSLCCVGVEAFR